MSSQNGLILSRGNPLPTSLVLFVVLFLLGSCGLGVRTKALFGEQMQVNVEISETANDNSPIAVDILLVHDEERLPDFLALSAKEWFAKREQIQRDNPDDPGFQIWSWEWVPGQRITGLQLPLDPKAKGGILYAHYHSPGEHRMRFSPNQDLEIRLKEDEVELTQEDH